MKRRKFPAVILVPAALLLLIAGCFGLPLNSWPSFLALSLGAVAGLVGTIRRDPRRWALACGVALACLVVRLVLPAHTIDEGHAVFSSDPRGPLAAALPAEVFDAMRRIQAGLPEIYDQKPARRAWAFAADGIWNPSPLSRSTGGIDFGDRWSLRVGGLIDTLYNDRRKGLYLPFVLRVDLPETTRGGRLCWTGTVFWPDEKATYTAITAPANECRDIPETFARRPGDGAAVLTLYAADFDPERPLAMRLDGTGLRDHAPTIALAVGSFGAVAVLLLLVRLRAAAVAGWAVAALSIVAYIAQRTSRGEPPAFSGLPFLGRGNDGLFYYSGGRSVLMNAVDGDWFEALRGGADVFYFSPGMRYLWAGLTGVFGDSFFGYFLVIVIAPFLVLLLLRVYAPPVAATLLFWCFLLVPVFEALGFLHWYYVKLAVRGFGGGIAWAALFAGVLILARRFDLPDARRGGLFVAGLLLAVAISCRPNLAVGVIVLVAGTALLLLRDRRFAVPVRLWDIAMLGLGSAAILGATLHNWYYGDVFVPLTRAWQVEANLELPPSAYPDAAAAILAGDPSWWDKTWRVLKHLRGWMNWYEFWFIIPYATLWVALFRREMTPFIRTLSAALIACHAVFLFYPGFPRYTYGIWLLTFLVFIAAMRCVYRPAAVRRWAALAAIRAPAWLRCVGYIDPVRDATVQRMQGPATGPATAAMRR